MDSLFGAEGSLIVRFVVAFVIVLALLGATFWVIRRFSGTRVGGSSQRGRQPRLAVIDAAPVDGRRRLVLIRRDNVEHLLMIGGTSDIVVEQNIVRAVPVTPPRDMPVPRAPAISEGGPPPRTIADRAQPEDNWTPPEPARSSFPRPEVPRVPRPLESRPTASERAFAPERSMTPEPRPYDPPVRSSLPAGLSPRPMEPAPDRAPMMTEPSTSEPADAELANMAQRLEAALRRPGAPEQARQPAPPVPAPDLAPDGPTNGDHAPPPDARPAKSKSVLDSLEEEMASLLGRPPEKT
jgi:flagellar protein FliO/FliZ